MAKQVKKTKNQPSEQELNAQYDAVQKVHSIQIKNRALLTSQPISPNAFDAYREVIDWIDGFIGQLEADLSALEAHMKSGEE